MDSWLAAYMEKTAKAPISHLREINTPMPFTDFCSITIWNGKYFDLYRQYIESAVEHSFNLEEETPT